VTNQYPFRLVLETMKAVREVKTYIMTSGEDQTKHIVRGIDRSWPIQEFVRHRNGTTHIYNLVCQGQFCVHVGGHDSFMAKHYSEIYNQSANHKPDAFYVWWRNQKGVFHLIDAEAWVVLVRSGVVECPVGFNSKAVVDPEEKVGPSNTLWERLAT